MAIVRDPRPGRRAARSARRRTPRRARRRSRSARSARRCDQEFPDISISKIRYLEDQKLLAPRRTPGRLPPLHPDRHPAAADDPAPAARRVPAAARDPPGARRAARSDRDGRHARRTRAPLRRRDGHASRDPGALYSLEDVRRGDRRRPASWSRELVEFGVIKGETARRRALLRRDRARDRPRGLRARPLRRRRAQPARVPQLRRSRGAAAAAASSRRRCARATPSGARRRSRRSRTSPSVTTHLKHLLLIRDLRKIAT